jgi:hypothetical protein
MVARTDRRLLALLWTSLLLPPLAWAAAHGVLFMLVDEACGGIPGSWLVLTGLLFAALAGCGALLAGRARHGIAGTDASAERGRFMASLALWLTPVFVLVVLLSASAVFFLSPCPQ